MLNILKSIRAYLRRPLISFMVYPIFIYWLLFSVFPASLDGSLAYGAIVFTLVILATLVLTLKILLIPVTLLAKLEASFIGFLRRRGLNYTPIRKSIFSI